MFNALDTSMTAERDVKTGKPGKKGAVDSASLSVPAPGGQKRKRKAPAREKDGGRDQEPETSSRATGSKVRMQAACMSTFY